jgi:hypothetical protein
MAVQVYVPPTSCSRAAAGGVIEKWALTCVFGRNQPHPIAVTCRRAFYTCVIGGGESSRSTRHKNFV